MSIDKKGNILKIFKYLKSTRSDHYLPMSNVYIHYIIGIRLINKYNRNICTYGH